MKLKPGLLMAFLAAVGATCITQVEQKDVKGEHVRLIQTYVPKTFQQVIGEVISKTKLTKQNQSVPISDIVDTKSRNTEDFIKDLKVLSLLYTKGNYDGYTVEITPETISVEIPEKVIVPYIPKKQPV